MLGYPENSLPLMATPSLSDCQESFLHSNRGVYREYRFYKVERQGTDTNKPTSEFHPYSSVSLEPFQVSQFASVSVFYRIKTREKYIEI